MNFMLSLVKTALVVLSSVYLTNEWNIFSFINFVPQDNKFDVSLILYMSTIDILLSSVIQKIKGTFNGELSCLFYSDIKKISKDNDPHIIFNDVDICCVHCVIKIKGAYRSFKDNNIKICLPRWISLQSMSRSVVQFEEVKRDIIIPLDQMIPENKKDVEYAELRFKLGFIREEFEGDYEITLTPEFAKKRLIKLEFNKINIST